MSTGNHLLRIKFSWLLVLCGFILTPLLHGQYSDVDLSVYKLPEIKLNKLDFQFSTNGILYNENQENNGNALERDEKRTSGNVKLSFNRTVNSKRYQESVLVNTGIDFSLSGTKNDMNQTNTETGQSDYAFSTSSSHRFYNSKNYFIEINPKVWTRLSCSEYTNKNDPENIRVYKNRFNYTAGIMSLSAGKGRIEPVQDLRLAIYILEELNKYDRIQELPSEEVLLEMAREISRIKRERFFDSRLRLMRELEVMDAFLTSRGIIGTQDISYFNILNDQWNYGSGPVRESGFTMQAGLDSELSRSCNFTDIDNIQTPDDEKYIDKYFTAGPFVRSRYEKPVNLYWQTSVDMKLAYMQEYYRYPNDEDSDSEGNYIAGQLNAELKYYPNTRTDMAVGISGYWQLHNYEMTNITEEEINYAISPVYLYINYYFSPRLRLAWTSAYRYVYSDYNYETNNDGTDTSLKRRSQQLNTSFQLIFSIF